MKKRFITMLPVAAAVLFLSGLNVDASGNFKFSNFLKHLFDILD